MRPIQNITRLLLHHPLGVCTQLRFQHLQETFIFKSLPGFGFMTLFNMCHESEYTCISCMEISYISLLVSEALNSTRLSKVTRSHG